MKPKTSAKRCSSPRRFGNEPFLSPPGNEQAEATKPATTYDVTVTLATGRLLVEVTGIDGYVSKASKKINQVLSTYQTEAQPEDRVCLALNAFRNHPLNARESVELITPDALNLLVSLKALVFTTVDLFPDLETGADEHEPRTSANRIATYCTPGIVRLRVADAES